jgi:hypothetical protein
VAPLVFVWIGASLPVWGPAALRLTKMLCGVDVVLISNRAVGVVGEVDTQYFIEDFYTSPETWKPYEQNFDVTFRDGFWLKTTERFFVLEQFVKAYALQSLFHAELDNLIFDISELASRLDQLGQGLFCPRDSGTRGIASLVYINDPRALTELNTFAIDNTLAEKNDMTVLGHLLSTSEKFFSLPTENCLQDHASRNWNVISPQRTQGIFDAAAIGQFLFGIDPRNGGILLFNGYENENKGCDLWQLQYRLKRKSNTFELTDPKTEQSINLFNIHVHSKLFKQLTNENRLSQILDRVNQGKKTLMNIDPMQNRIVRGIRSRLIARQK